MPCGLRIRFLFVALGCLSVAAPAWSADPIKISGPMVAGGDAFEPQFSPDGSLVLYLADQETDTVQEIYTVPATGGAPTKLNGPMVAGGFVFAGTERFSPDGNNVLYTDISHLGLA